MGGYLNLSNNLTDSWISAIVACTDGTRIAEARIDLSNFASNRQVWEYWFARPGRGSGTRAAMPYAIDGLVAHSCGSRRTGQR